MKTQYMHALMIKSTLAKGVTVHAIGYVFNWSPELNPGQHTLMSCMDVKGLAEAYIHVRDSGTAPGPLVLVDHTKGQQVSSLVAEMTQKVKEA